MRTILTVPQAKAVDLAMSSPASKLPTFLFFPLRKTKQNKTKQNKNKLGSGGTCL
jgi:hypothetical protein